MSIAIAYTLGTFLFHDELNSLKASINKTFNRDPLLEEIKQNLKENYLEPLSDEQIEENIRKGLVSQTHRFCYYEKRDQEYFDSPKKVGAFIVFRSGHYYIQYIIPGSCAEKSFLQEGDEIIRIDDNLILHTKNALRILDSPKYLQQDQTIWWILRNNSLMVVPLKKTECTQPTVLYKKFDNILYIKIMSFDPSTYDEFYKIISDNSSSDGYVLDVRNNPGGLLRVLDQIISYFLPRKVPLFQLEHRDWEQLVSSQPNDGSCLKKPLVVLINGNSWSASEVLAAVLQYHKRAAVVGTQSGGKGVGQSVIHLSNGDSLYIPSAYIYLPDHTTWDQNGVIPDYEIEGGLSILTFGDIVPEKDPQLKKALEILQKNSQ